MPHLELGPGESVYFEHHAPARAGAPCFAFVNDLVGEMDGWEAAVAPALRAEGFGTLLFNHRGQARSEFRAETALTPKGMISDLRLLLRTVLTEPPILVGLSLGGLCAAQAHLGGARAQGLALINTLREPGPRLDWVDQAMPLLAMAGGRPLLRDALLPLLASPEYLGALREAGPAPDYAPLAPEDGLVTLLRHAREAEWRLDYEALRLPVLVITGLHDRVYLDREVVNRLIERLPDIRSEVFEAAGHFAAQERPDDLALSLARFALELERRAAA
ncbi:MAG: alpha/beta fold hydrolase [Pseudomonadota bacterium]